MMIPPVILLGGITQSLFESEMFGHKKGAFTDAHIDRTGRFEVADKGTIFLDEIGDLELSCQVKLLRVLQDQTFEALGDSRPRKVDVRVVSAAKIFPCSPNICQTTSQSKRFTPAEIHAIGMGLFAVAPLSRQYP
ncbi:hypothetical protein FACS189426_11600 [Bacteroidia bacterium]|nr:hypothetical protein FACS189426_11600 [Bacteroidia bacterium]